MTESTFPAYCNSCIIAASADQHDTKLSISVDRSAGAFYVVRTMQVVRMPLGTKDAAYDRRVCASCGGTLSRGESY